MRLPIPRIVAALCCLGGLLSACAPAQPRQADSDGRIESRGHVSGAAGDAESSASKPDMEYTVQRGDTLFEIAHSTTGDGRNWRLIAANNGIFEPARIAVGQQIQIPGRLLSASRRERKVTTVEASKAAGTGGASNDGGPDASPRARDQADTAGWIEISGSYYSREVNQQPDIASPIVKRVAPGSRLSYVGRTDGWYKVELDSGYGYVNAHYAAPANAHR